jgi:hypothetical protein
MEYLSYSVDSNALWHAHRQLSSLPGSLPDAAPQSRFDSARLSFGVNTLKRSVIKLLLNELDSEQQIQYLERCLALDASYTTAKPISFLSGVWQLLQ